MLLNQYTVFGLFFFSIIMHTLAQHYAYSQGKEINNTIVLPDITFRYLKESRYTEFDVLIFVNDVLPVLIVAYLVYLMIIHKRTYLILDYLFILSIVYLLRALLFTITTLPDPSQRCNPYGLMGACNDLVYSGHIAITTITLLFIYYNFHRSSKFLGIMILYLFITSFVILKNRNHYTLDVVLALIISVLLYHQLKHVKIDVR